MTPEEKAAVRILVVDDNDLIADTTAMILLSVGFNAVATYNPNEALRLAKEGSFDLLLSDVIMPEMSGIELAILVKESDYIPKVLLMSGMSATTDLLKDAHARGYDFEVLAKPMHASELIDKIREMLA